MNQGQSVVVAKQKGFVSRIISTLIVFSVTCIVVCGGVAGLYFAFPSKVSPIMKKFGFLIQEPVHEKNKEVSVAKEIPTNPLDITLNDEDWQRLRSTNVILLATDKGDGFRVISPPEKEQGLNDNDLEALIPISSKVLSLDLTYAEITDSGITVLSKFENLQRLYLEGNKEVTVQGLAQLKNLTNLTYLNLVRIELNEELVDLLISMENLREIYLYETGLNEAAITRLTDARPKVFVNGG
jgi:Leucine-rich repeat (LRR) protein